MRLDIGEYNCMLDRWEEGIIGHIKDLTLLYKDYVKQMCEDNMYDYNMKEVIDLIMKLEQLDSMWLAKVDYPYKEYFIKIISKEV